MKQIQQMYSAALYLLKIAQSPGRLDNIELLLGNKTKVFNLKFPIMFIIGDNQGGNTICRRSFHYGINSRRISRTCNAGPDQLSKPEMDTCKRFIKKDMMTLVQDKEWERLDDLFQAQH